MTDGDRYTHGHHESVLRSHTWRTAHNSAGFLLPHLRAGDEVLDVGCGPGTITADLATIVAPGSVTGIDRSDEVLALAREHADQLSVSNVTFQTGDVYHLAFASDAFDVVYAHQVLQHLSRPVDALVEVRRVLRPGGLVALREVDFGCFVFFPDDSRFHRFLELYRDVTRANGTEAYAGRRLAAWTREAGFSDVTLSSSTWTFSSSAERAWWGGLWADRIRLSSIAEQAVDEGYATVEELDDLANAFTEWAANDEGSFFTVHGEVLARA